MMREPGESGKGVLVEERESDGGGVGPVEKAAR